MKKIAQEHYCSQRVMFTCKDDADVRGSVAKQFLWERSEQNMPLSRAVPLFGTIYLSGIA
jgi:hypothetical protein